MPREVLASLIAVNGGLAAMAVVLNVWYMHRQRVRLRGIGTLLKEAAAADDHQP